MQRKMTQNERITAETKENNMWVGSWRWWAIWRIFWKLGQDAPPFTIGFCHTFLCVPVIVFLLIFFIHEILSWSNASPFFGPFEPAGLFQNRSVSHLHRKFCMFQAMIERSKFFWKKLWAQIFRFFLSDSNSFISGVFCIRNHLGGGGYPLHILPVRWKFSNPKAIYFIIRSSWKTHVPVELPVRAVVQGPRPLPNVREGGGGSQDDSSIIFPKSAEIGGYSCIINLNH